MEAWKSEAGELLRSGAVKTVIGYAVGTNGARRPAFARSPEQAEALVLDAACVRNLGVYLTRAEVRRLGGVALVAIPATLRAALQLAAERQWEEGAFCLIAVEGAEAKVLRSAAELEAHLALRPLGPSEETKAELERLRGLSPAARWAFWQAELSRCVKCYACRQSCPMCYCPQCTMDCNRPQWVPVPSHGLGNFEYHLVRAMHLAGRCVECGECGRACPAGIPVHLLTVFAEESSARQFGQRAGGSARLDYALSTFKPDDKETFIR
jgi:ferredoxin